MNIDDKTAQDMGLQAALSSGAAGGLYGLGFATLGGKRKLADILKFAAKAGLISGTIGGGGTYVGTKILGAPDAEETTGMTRRATVGGGVLGTGLGAGLGAAIGGGAFKPDRKANLVTEYLAKLGGKPTLGNMAKGAAVTGLAGGLIGAYLGNDEGMMLDFIDQEKKQRQRIEAAQRAAMMQKMLKEGGLDGP